MRGASQIGEVPASYRCYKCHKGGHWIKNCPVVPGKDAANPHFHNHFKNKHDAPKRTTGIPRTFIREPETEAPSQSSQNQTIELKEEIPEDLICSICKDIFVDAVMIPCCGSSFCDECKLNSTKMY